MNLVQKLRSLVDDIAAHKDPLQTVRDLETFARLSSRTPADQARVTAAVKLRDVAELDAIVRALETPGEVKPATPVAVFSEDDKHAALRALKKRIKLAKLADESKLGGRYTSGGRKSDIGAVQPPTEFDPKIWKTLAAEGRVTDAGQGFYGVPDEPGKH